MGNSAYTSAMHRTSHDHLARYPRTRPASVDGYWSHEPRLQASRLLLHLSRATSAGMSEQATVAIPRIPLPRRGPSRDRRQIVEMQRELHALTLDPNVPPRERAQCARAWADLQEKKRVLDGKPMPGHLRPDLEQKRKRQVPALAPLPELAPREQSSESNQTDHEPATAVDVVSTAKPAAPAAPCPVCHGGGTIKVSGGNVISCTVCHGAGTRLDT